MICRFCGEVIIRADWAIPVGDYGRYRTVGGYVSCDGEMEQAHLPLRFEDEYLMDIAVNL